MKIIVLKYVSTQSDIANMSKKVQTRSTEASVDKKDDSLLTPVRELDKFPETELPTYGQVFGRVYRVVTLMTQVNVDDAIKQVARELEDQWTRCNVYPFNKLTIVKHLLYEFKGTTDQKSKREGTKHCGYHILKTMSTEKRSRLTYIELCQQMNDKLPTLFDIIADEKSRQTRIDAGHPEMTEQEWKVYFFIYHHHHLKS
jgi:hypothetical protein